MTNYVKIKDEYKRQYGRTVKTCWIADVKRKVGLPTKVSNRRINPNEIANPCPESIRPNLEPIIEKVYTITEKVRKSAKKFVFGIGGSFLR